MSERTESAENQTVETSDGTIHHQFDWSNVPPSTAVVETIADAAGCDPVDINVLHDAVDPDALDTLLQAETDTDSEATHVSFIYAGFDVVLRSDGTLLIHPSAQNPNDP